MYYDTKLGEIYKMHQNQELNKFSCCHGKCQDIYWL
jgi:hypothetical protein